LKINYSLKDDELYYEYFKIIKKELKTTLEEFDQKWVNYEKVKK